MRPDLFHCLDLIDGLCRIQFVQGILDGAGERFRGNAGPDNKGDGHDETEGVPRRVGVDLQVGKIHFGINWCSNTFLAVRTVHANNGVNGARIIDIDLLTELQTA